MATYGEIKARLADDFNRSDLTSQIANEINRAIRYYSSTRFWFNEAIAGSVVTANQQAYSPSSLSASDLLILTNVEITVSSHKYELDERSWEEFIPRWRDTGTYTGAPDDYAFYANQIWLGPAPNDGYSIDLCYIKLLPTLSSDSDTNAWTEYAEDLISARAGKIIAARTIKSEKDALTYALLEKDALSSLMVLNDQKVMTGSARYKG